MSQRKKANRTKYDDDISFYHYSKFKNVKLINKNVKNVYKAKIGSRRKKIVVTLKYISLNNKITLNNFINEVKRHRELENNDSILKFYGITKQEDTNNYMIVLNECSLRQYLKTNFQKMNWNAKLNIANQIANVLMFLRSNDIINGKLNSENILIHNGIIKFNAFGLKNFFSDSLNFLTNNPGSTQYMDSRNLELFSKIGKNKSSDIFGLGIILWEISSGSPPFEMESSLNVVDLLNNIIKGKREIAIPGTPRKYKEIYTDCWRHNGDSRPNISQIVKNLSEIIISDVSVQPYNVTDVEYTQNEEPEIKPDSPFFDVPKETTEVNVFIKDLFGFLIDLFTRQFREIRPITIKNYIREHKKNPVKILYAMIRHPSYYWFTSLIGFFYQHGIGTVADNQMAFKFFNLAANYTSSSNSSSLRTIYNINKEIGMISIAYVYLYGLGVDKDKKKAFQISKKLADKGSLMASNIVAYCYYNGSGVRENDEKAFELHLKSAEKGFLGAQSNVFVCYQNGIGISKDGVQGFQWIRKSALAGNITAMGYVGDCYAGGVGVCKDEKEAFKWYLKAAEKEHNTAQHDLGCCYKDGEGIVRDNKKAFEWFKKAAENNFADSQYMIGKFLYEGCGTKKDIIKAIYWLNKANENGNTDADVLLDEIFFDMLF
ncbi:hypothetical protein Glove_553g6 [Diversispora epigaea]|uniref:Protein kinase domain-containing protein n=1 Tax=Diversispora epigaea TaxID=1348612 RepID=A0A397GEQ7_9GLOM|nr:hypothetical protein Glove_553g6 [Diversispora epigaea]